MVHRRHRALSVLLPLVLASLPTSHGAPMATPASSQSALMPRPARNSAWIDPSSAIAAVRRRVRADPVVSPEYPVSDPLGGTSGQVNYFSESRIAWGWTVHLVVWSEGYRIRGMRVGADGAPLDDVSIYIGDSDGTTPGVTFDGVNFVVVWTQMCCGYDVIAARVSTDGVVMDSPAVALGDGDHPSIASNGTSSLAVWVDRPTGQIWGGRIDPDGSALDGSGFQISTPPPGYGDDLPDVASEGPDYLVVWQRDIDLQEGTADVYGARVAAGGTPLDPNGIAINTSQGDQTSPSVASRGTNYLVVWRSGRDVRGSLVKLSGQVVNHPALRITDVPIAGPPDAVSDGQLYLVVWQLLGYPDDDEILGARLRGQGELLDPHGFTVSGDPSWDSDPGVAWGGSDYLVSWTANEDPSSPPNVHAKRVSRKAEVLDAGPLRLNLVAQPQYNPAVAWNGNEYLVAWSDDQYWAEGSLDVFIARVDASGAILDGTGIPLAIAGEDETNPAVGWDGHNFLVVWEVTRYEYSGQDYHDLMAARVAPDGIVLDPAGFILTRADGDEHWPAVSSDGRGFLVVWEQQKAGDQFQARAIFGARVSPRGHVIDADGFPISSSPVEYAGPSIAWSGSVFLVAWEQNLGIWGARVEPGVGVLDPGGFLMQEAGSGRLVTPRVASDGAQFLAVWGTQPVVGCPGPVEGVRVDPVEGVIDAEPITFATTAGFGGVAWGGTNFLVLWADYEGTWGTRVSPDGTLIDPDGFLIISADQPLFDQAPAGGPIGTVAFAYVRSAPEVPYGSVRTFLRFISEST